MEIQHDAHMHTYLSRCSNDSKFLPPAIIERSAANGIKLLGFTDHMWDKTMPGGDNPVYRNQDYDHVTNIHGMMPENTMGMKILFGCETEYYGRGMIGISPAVAERFDYILVPTNHSLTSYAKEEGLCTPSDIGGELIRRFREIMGFDVTKAICHPMLPIGFFEIGDEIFNSISDDELNECFSIAMERNISIEINSCTFPGIYDRGTKGFTDDTYLRIISIAKKAGCRFHFASDAHSLGDIDRLQQLGPYLDMLGISDSDIHTMFRV